MPLPSSGSDLLISETFVSLQGEGASVGTPAAFVRLGGCNLACSYCDTPYTWDERRFELEKELTAEPLEKLERFLLEKAPGRVIFTGGEPLIQQRKLVALLSRVDSVWCDQKSDTLFVEVETNGTIEPCEELRQRVNQWNVSPKLAGSGESLGRRRRLAVLRSFAELSGAFFKFVVTSREDVKEVAELRRLLGLSGSRVLLMPEAESPAGLEQRSPQVAAWALEAGVRFSTRLHLQLYGARRGT